MATDANNVPKINYIGNDGVNLTLNPGDTNYLRADPFLNVLSPNKYLSFPNNSTITLAPRTVNYAANTLGTTKHSYTSPLQSDIIALANYFADFGFSYQIAEGPVYTITVDIAQDTITNEDLVVSEYASEQWEIVPVQGSKSLIYSGLIPNPFAPPTNTGNYQTLPLTLQSAIQRANKTGGNYLNITSSLTPAEQAQYAGKVVTANLILQYLKLGIEGIPQYTQTLKRTAVIDVHNTQGAFKTEADTFQRTLNDQGTVNYVLSAQDMLNNYAIPAHTVGQFMLPSYSKVLGIPNLDPIIYSVYAGYLVQPPTVSFIGLNKVQITQLFVWDEYASGLYYIPSDPADFPLIYTAS